MKITLWNYGINSNQVFLFGFYNYIITPKDSAILYFNEYGSIRYDLLKMK